MPTNTVQKLLGVRGVGERIITRTDVDNIAFGIFVVEDIESQLVFYGVLNEPAQGTNTVFRIVTMF